MRQLKTHLSTASPYGWMWSGGAPLITFMVLLGGRGAACIIISTQAERWNHKSAEHAQAETVSSWPRGTSHLFGWECLRTFSLGQWHSVNVPAWKISLRWDVCKMIRDFQYVIVSLLCRPKSNSQILYMTLFTLLDEKESQLLGSEKVPPLYYLKVNLINYL